MKRVALFLTGVKGLAVAKVALAHINLGFVFNFYVRYDKNTLGDATQEIVDLCESHGYEVGVHPSVLSDFGNVDYCMLAGWQLILRGVEEDKLIVFHDSLLPRYRGFSPLVSALINRDGSVGVTALKGAAEYDRGDIYVQRSMSIDYPIKIESALNKVANVYEQVTADVLHLISIGALCGVAQDESLATYSLWRDDEDYRISWANSASEIENFVNSVGYPYKGASTTVDGCLMRVYDVEALPDVAIENRVNGKIIFFDENSRPVVVCGYGLLRINKICRDGDHVDYVPKFRTRFV